MMADDDRATNRTEEEAGTVAVERKRMERKFSVEQDANDKNGGATRKQVKAAIEEKVGVVEDTAAKEPLDEKQQHEDSHTTIEQDVVAEREQKQDGHDGETTTTSSGKKTRKRRKAETATVVVESHSPYSKRSRKSAESFTPENFAIPKKDAVTIIDGRGTKLGDMTNVKESIQSYNNNSEPVVAAHKFLFGKVGKHRQDHLLDFSGYLPAIAEGQDKDERDKQDERIETKMAQKAYKLLVPDLKMLCDVFDVDRTPTSIDKDELVERLLDFLSVPSVKLTNAGSKKSAGKRKKSPPKKKRGKKRKQEEDTEEEEDTARDEQESSELPSDKALRKWVKAYVACFNLNNVTVHHAVTTASDKFGIDITEKKDVLKQMLIELM